MRTLRYGAPFLAAGMLFGGGAFAFAAITGQAMTHGLQRMTKMNAKPSYRFSTSGCPFLQDIATHYIDRDEYSANKVLGLAITRGSAVCAGTEHGLFCRRATHGWQARLSRNARFRADLMAAYCPARQPPGNDLARYIPFRIGNRKAPPTRFLPGETTIALTEEIRSTDHVSPDRAHSL